MEKILLASGSPRRQEILDKFDIDYRVEKSNIVEKVRRKERPEVVSMALAFEKARNVSKSLDDESLIIAADTIVVKEGRVLGKVESKKEAKETLLELSSDYHDVITGIALYSKKRRKKIVDYEKTRIKFRSLDEGMIDSYLETGEYKDKAGGYAIQGKGSILVERIQGCYFNVVGLPIYKLDILLREHFDMGLL